MKIKKLLIILLIALLFILVFIVLFNSKSPKLDNTENIKVMNSTVYLDSFNLRQKIGQMIMVRGDSEENMALLNLNVGGIFLDRQDSEDNYTGLIKKYQENSKIRLLVATDLEGAWSPFHNPESHQRFPYFSDINDSKEAYEVGLEHGKLLKKIGFDINFAPVAEYLDEAYGGRTFFGTKEEIKDKLEAYILGLQKNVLGTCKHYPGKTLKKNLHTERDRSTITKEDLELFQLCIDRNISAVMVSHPVAEGELNSHGRPASVSKEVISSLPQNVLVVADEINMQGLKSFYPFNKREMYIDLINSGNNLILDFELDKKSAYKLISELELDVKSGKIEEEKINESVKKILKLKGYSIN